MKTITDFTSIETFKTHRLYAQRISHDDLDKLLAMHGNPKVMATLGGLRSSEQTKENLAWNLSQWTQNGFGLWMFYLIDTNEWIGRGGLRRVEVGGREEIELSYALLPAFWKQGYATEMANACVEIAFEVLRLEKIVCFTLNTNLASQRVMNKTGFHYERDISHAGLPHVLYRMKNPRKIVMNPHHPKWPDYFKLESERIKSVLSDELIEIHHIGSTAIPGMPAKPVIDMLLICENLDRINLIRKQLQILNYINLRRHIIPQRSYFIRRQDEHISYHLHIHEKGSPQINRHIHFRDYLIQHPDEATEYAHLKQELAEKYHDNMNAYVSGKDKLVQAIDARAKSWPGRRIDFPGANTGPAAGDWNHEKLIKAMISNMNVHMTHFAQYINDIDLIRIPGFTIVNSRLPDDTFNYVIDADFSSAEAGNKISEITNYFAQANSPFSWWISPYDSPTDLNRQLEAHGYEKAENNIAMYFNLDAWDGQTASVPHLEIRQAQDEKALRDFALVSPNDPSSFEKYHSWIASVLTSEDPIEYYIGYVNDKPVVRGVICYFAQAAGLYWLSTDPGERHKGYGTAMQLYRLKRAKESGYHIAFLQASHEGYSLYKKLGYKACSEFSRYKRVQSCP